jgi:lysozyme
MRHSPRALLALTLTIIGCAPSAGAPEPLGDTSEAVKTCPRGPTVRGVDVSYYQGHIDWPTARAAGIAFAFVRVSDGATFVDPELGANWKGTKSAGLLRGAYQYFRPAQDPIAQADVLIRELRAAGGLESGDLPPALDIEVTDGVAPADLQRRALAWLARVESAVGRKPLIYTSPSFWEDLDPSDAFAPNPLWIAHWDTPCPSIPTTWSRWHFWQDSDSGTIPGIPGPVDTNRFDGTLADLHTFAGATPPKRQKSPAKPRLSRPRRNTNPPAQPAPLAAVDILGSIMRTALGGRSKR